MATTKTPREKLAAELEFLSTLLRTQRPHCGQRQADHDRAVLAEVAERLAMLASEIQGE